jgi:hypothetical protein
MYVCPRYIALVSPVMTMLFLLLLSGLPAAEGPALAKYMKTEEYVDCDGLETLNAEPGCGG